MFADFRHNITVQKEDLSLYDKRNYGDGTHVESPPVTPTHGLPPPRFRAIASEYRVQYLTVSRDNCYH